MTQIQKIGLDYEPTNREIFEVLLDFKGRFDGIDGRFDAVDTRFDAMDTRFDAMDRRFDEMDERFDGMQEFVGEMKVEMEEKFDSVNNQFDKINIHFTDVYHKLDDLRGDIRRVDEKVDTANQRLLRLEKRSNEDIIAVGTSLIDLRKKVKKLEGMKVE